MADQPEQAGAENLLRAIQGAIPRMSLNIPVPPGTKPPPAPGQQSSAKASEQK